MDLEALVDQLRRRHHLPGCQVAVTSPEGDAAVATGTANVRSGVEVTPDTAFQLCSITKVFTATLVAQLVGEGVVGVDDPVVAHLPSFRLADSGLARHVTVGHLLDHTSGIDGDVLVDTGRGADAVDRYVDALAGVGAVHPLGAAVSYCNAGYSVLGQLVARAGKATYEQVVRDRLLDPLGMTTAGTFPEEAAMGRVAVGHHGNTGAFTVDPTFAIWRSQVPAGGIFSSATDLLAFARLHLTDPALAWMRTPLRSTPDPLGLGKRHGLGWLVSRWGDVDVVGHDGGAFGQLSFLRLFPSTGVAVAALTNGDGGTAFFGDLMAEIGPALVGAAPPAPWWQGRPERPHGELSVRTGTYGSAMLDLAVTEHGGGLRLGLRSTAPAAVALGEPESTTLDLEHVSGELWAAQLGDDGPRIPVGFVDFDGAPSAVTFGSRLSPKVA